MSTTAKLLRDLGDVHLAFAAQADAKTLVGHFAKKNRDLHVMNRKSVVDQSLAVFLFGLAGLHLRLSHRDPGNASLAMKV